MFDAKKFTCWSGILFGLICCLAIPLRGHGETPENDDFENRRLLIGSIAEDSIDNTLATTEIDEPLNTNRYGRTVWWTWTAPANGQATIQVSGYGAVWRGDALSSIVLLADNAISTIVIGPIPFLNTIQLPILAPRAIRFHVTEGEIFQISAATDKLTAGFSPTSHIDLTLDLSTIHIDEPIDDSLFASSTGVVVRVSSPDPVIDGVISTPLFAIRLAHPFGAFTTNRFADPGSFSTTVSNLPAGDYEIFAQFTNMANRLLLTPTNRFHIRPGNDDFLAAKPIPSLPFRESFTFYNATIEPGEPSFPVEPGSASLWWKFVPDHDGTVWVHGSSLFDFFALDEAGLQQSDWNVTNGGIYYLRATQVLGSRVDAEQFYYLTWYPPNDTFNNRKVLVGPSVVDSVDLTASARQAGEPFDCSVWWSWTAPASGLANLTVGPYSWAAASVWQGDSLTNLTLVTDTVRHGLTSDRYWFPAEEGQTYQICIGANPFPIVASFSLDLCSMRIVEPPGGSEFTGTTNVQVRITPPRIDVEGQLTYLAIWALSSTTRDYDSSVAYDSSVDPSPSFTGTFSNLPPDVYTFSIAATNSAGRLMISLTNVITIHPANDNFASAKPIQQVPYSDQYQLISASDEPNEPALPVFGSAGSVWWRWAAPSNMVVVADAAGPISAFVGDSLDNLVPVGTSWERVLRLPAEAGKTYYLRVNPELFFVGFPPTGMQGTVVLEQALPNDDFENRIRLASGRIMFPVPRGIASFQPGEVTPNIWRPNTGSLWWTWTAPSNGLFLLEAIPTPGENLFYRMREVYSGDAVQSLVSRPLYYDPQFGSINAPWGSLIVTNNETLQIALNTGDAQNDVFFQIYFRATPERGALGQPLSFTGDPQFHLPMLGGTGTSITLETSYDLSNWFEYRTLTPTNDGPFLFGPISPDGAARFFRVR